MVDKKYSKLIDEVVYGSSFYDVFTSLLDWSITIFLFILEDFIFNHWVKLSCLIEREITSLFVYHVFPMVVYKIEVGSRRFDIGDYVSGTKWHLLTFWVDCIEDDLRSSKTYHLYKKLLFFVLSEICRDG